MGTTYVHTCTLCEATCGIKVTVDGGRVVDVRGDERDVFSRGYICPKATALADLHHDPDRLRRPLVRTGRQWREAGWAEAFDLAGGHLRRIRRTHGKDAIGVYQGNPTVHNLGLVTYGQLLFRNLRTRNLFSATSVDQLPHMLAALQMFGHQLLMPVPDVDRCDLFVCLGGNPAVSNGSIMTAPNMRARLRAIRDRGGSVVVIDPRRTETAALADRHLFIRPGTDALLLMSLVNVLFSDDLVSRVPPLLRGVDTIRTAATGFTPAATAPVTGVDPTQVRELALALATTERAVLYGRVGVCTQEFGGLAAWLVVVVNALTGHLDTPGGSMFTSPAIDPVPLLARLRHGGGFDRFRSRVSGLPEFGGELPVAALAEEIETPGPRQIRALITSAGNPVLSTPNGARLEAATARLDFMVSIDPYLNETTRLADVILPPTGPLERPHYEIALAMYSVRNIAKYAPAVFQRTPEQRHDWEICVELATRLFPFGRVVRPAARRLSPEKLLGLALRAGGTGLSSRTLRNAPHGVDLGPLQPRLPGRLRTPDRKVDLAPRLYLDDVPRLRARLAAPSDQIVLIGRRQLRSNNSWMHNSERLVKGRPRCTLLVHPDDAAAHGLTDGGLATVTSRAGAIDAPVEVTDSIMRGVVSLPHGWGHHREGVRLTIASAHPGASINDVTDEGRVDPLTGTSALSGLPVTITPAAR
ncbi:MAG TPA: molybdopterin oxidoreductase family protein [Pseudonocardiaceae bacterium]|nr:molybdopterin oxidoreductase family protein [Pseudonocardiaceae bacterium]